jgi:hypothetical protein
MRQYEKRRVNHRDSGKPYASSANRRFFAHRGVAPFYIKCDPRDLSPAINAIVSMSVGFTRTKHEQCWRPAVLRSVYARSGVQCIRCFDEYSTTAYAHRLPACADFMPGPTAGLGRDRCLETECRSETAIRGSRPFTSHMNPTTLAI